MYNSRNQIVSKFVEKLLKYRIMFRDILTCLGLNYIDALLIRLYFVVLGISIPKIRSIGKLYHIKFFVKKLKIKMFKMNVRTFW